MDDAFCGPSSASNEVGMWGDSSSRSYLDVLLSVCCEVALKVHESSWVWRKVLLKAHVSLWVWHEVALKAHAILWV